MHPDKVKNVLNMSGQDRYNYFVRKVADFQVVWGLFADGWATAEDDNGHKVIVFWPEEEFANQCAVDGWANCKPRSIGLDYFLKKWIPGMSNDGVRVGVFPTPVNQGVVVDPALLESAISAELEALEGSDTVE